jgi:hypothetical protein
MTAGDVAERDLAYEVDLSKTYFDDRARRDCCGEQHSFLYLVEKTSIRVPVVDLLDWLQFYGERSKDNWLGYLWTPHNEHRMIFSRILLAIDVEWFGDQGEAFAVSGFVLLKTAN